VDGITASLLALKKRPAIRYQKNSAVAENVANLVAVSPSNTDFMFGLQLTLVLASCFFFLFFLFCGIPV
jgi:hypothetical protein